jgi:hypothetical protein
VAILASETGEPKTFLPVSPERVPAWVKGEEMIGRMVQGEQVQHVDGGPWFAGLPLEASPILIDQPRLGIKR